MKYLKYFLAIIIFSITQILLGQTAKAVDSFEKVIISPHIQATFVEGEEESVIIQESTEPEDKINIEVKSNVLRVYLDDAKETTKNETVVVNGIKRQVPIYKGKVLTIIVHYKQLKALSIKGEQSIICKSKIATETFKLKMYGESETIFKDVNFKFMDADIYGASRLTINKGTIENQKITAYGESVIDLLGVDNKNTKLKAFGEAEFKIQASDRIKLTAFGEAKLYYKGDASIDKGLNIGAVEITEIQ
ncbi:GIN domain-containing protein [Aquimarina sp. SS2-1]|uniref:GIN domain-containing protein n=1 Tax=Aquimarina besae TaxID=3342247 RepID=UPI0036736368